MGTPVSEPPRVYLDSNVFITAMETPGAHSDHAWWIIHAIDDGKIAAVTSELTLAEVLVKPMQLGDAEFASAYEEMIAPGPNFEVLAVRRDILVDAARLRARRNAIRLPDAIHIATALASSCTHMVSDDQQLRSIEGVRLLPITPFALDDILARPNE
jgi:predicted nucleic acid-binding protein